MAAGKTVPELTAATDVQDADLLASYRSPGPLKKLTATTFSEYVGGNLTDNGTIPSVASRTNLAALTIKAAIKQIATRGYAAEGDGGGANYVRTSYATIVSESYPTASYQRSTDRFMPDGSTDATNGGYWLLSETEITPQMFGAVADGATPDQAAINALAETVLASGARVRIPSGTYIVASTVTFAAAELMMVCEPGVVFKQADSTLSMDFMMIVSGDNAQITGWPEFNGNLAGNSGTYTGRGELLRVSGNRCRVQIRGNGTQDNGLGCVIYNAGLYNEFYLRSQNTGSNAVRCAGDYGSFFLWMHEYGEHGFVKDNAPGGLASNYTYVKVYEAVTSKTEMTEAVLFDHDGVQGNACLVEFGYLSAPNSDGPDFIKFAYMRDVTLRGFRGTHKNVAAHRVTLRIQEDVDRLTLDDCIFPGSVNFDATVDCFLTVTGGTVFGNEFSGGSSVGDFRGIASFEDGTQFLNCTTDAVSTTNDDSGTNSILNFGRCVFNGAATFTPNVVRFTQTAVSGATRRIVAANVTIRYPLQVSGTFKSLPVNGRWIGLNETQDAACAQAGDRVFLASAGDFPPRDAEGWRLGDVLRNRAAAAGATPAEYRCTTAGASCTAAWAISTAYTVGNWRHNGGNVYACVTAGTSAGAGGPTGTGTGIADGTAVWDYVAPLAVFKGVSSIAA